MLFGGLVKFVWMLFCERVALKLLWLEMTIIIIIVKLQNMWNQFCEKCSVAARFTDELSVTRRTKRAHVQNGEPHSLTIQLLHWFTGRNCNVVRPKTHLRRLLLLFIMFIFQMIRKKTTIGIEQQVKPNACETRNKSCYTIFPSKLVPFVRAGRNAIRALFSTTHALSYYQQSLTFGTFQFQTQFKCNEMHFWFVSYSLRLRLHLKAFCLSIEDAVHFNWTFVRKSLKTT